MAVATLAHTELYCTDLEASLEHFTRVLSFSESHREDGSVYLRAYGDWDTYTLILTESDDRLGLGHVAFKVEAEEELEAYAERVEASGYETRWLEPGAEPGQGRAVRFSYPGSHPEHEHELELVYDMERADVPKGARSRLKNQPQGYADVGVGTRRIDHLNVMVPNVTECKEWMADVLDFKLRERIVFDDGEEKGVWMSVTPIVHEIAFVKNETPQLNHVAWYLKYLGELFRAVDVIKDAPTGEIYAGPSQHGVTQANFMYHVEPSGNLFELFNGGYLIFDPQWEPITWTEDELPNALEWWDRDDQVYDWPQSAEKRPGAEDR